MTQWMIVNELGAKLHAFPFLDASLADVLVDDINDVRLVVEYFENLSLRFVNLVANQTTPLQISLQEKERRKKKTQ